jgi:pSer/pThr/pTyr-binding forkhead associated (FHA) protein
MLVEVLTLSWLVNEEVVLTVNNLDVLGRDKEHARVSLPDPCLSRKHCKFYRNQDGWQVEDCHSLNGTFVNEIPVFAGKVNVIVPGDVLRVGTLQFRVGVDMVG